MDLTELLLAEANIVVVPGGPFGEDNHLRLSYATSMDTIITGLDRMEELISAIR